MQARFSTAQVHITGASEVWHRIADSGEKADQHFCPTCGSTLWYHSRPNRELIAIPVGAFADPAFPAPQFSVYARRMHHWLEISGKAVEHHD
jgi:hypothetical protein